MGRVAVIGDIGGHSDELYAALVGLGAHPVSLDLPEDLTVVQAGDLVHRGPDSPGVLDIVEQQLAAGQWVQLVGNHETNELVEPQFVFESLEPADQDRLRSWHVSRRLHAAAVVEVAGRGEMLVTHAGLTRGFYEELGRPAEAVEVAEALDHLLWDPSGMAILCRAGYMLETRFPLTSAGPIWAHDGLELCPGWLDHEAPFDQAHGHTSLYHWSKGAFQAPAPVREATELDLQRRHTVTMTAGGRRIVGLDPGLGRHAGVRWEPLVFEGCVLYPVLAPVPVAASAAA